MYELTNGIMLLAPHNREFFARWWEASDYYRRRRDAL
jgi:hypothetical protein